VRVKKLIHFIVGLFLMGQFPVEASKQVCKEAISKQESQKGIPRDLLKAIASVESGISPWAVNAHGRAHIFPSKQGAVTYIRQLLEEGSGNFSIGCMQLHYASHRRHFTSIEDMLEPEKNIAHAAKLIKNLERRHGSMDRAIKLYHSPTPAYHNRYKNRVYSMWAKFQKTNKGDESLSKIALKDPHSQKPLSNAQKRSTKIKFGIGAASLVKDRHRKT